MEYIKFLNTYYTNELAVTKLLQIKVLHKSRLFLYFRCLLNPPNYF